MTSASDPPSGYIPTERTTVRRAPQRASYDRGVVHAVLDEALYCHVGFCVDSGPVVIPTIHCRIDETLYLHGSPASRLLRSLQEGLDRCVIVTLVDGLVLARSAFHHSMNYRSVVAFGRAHPVTDLAERARVLDGFVEHVVPGRRSELRGHTEKELRGTQVLALPLEEVSAKVRSGGPNDEPEDLGLPVWAGVLPLGLEPGRPRSDSPTGSVQPPPDYLVRYTRS